VVPPSSSSASTTFRKLHPPSVARLYGRFGLFAGQAAPGGSGIARSVSVDDTILSRKGGAAYDLSSLELPAPPSRRETSVANERYARQKEAAKPDSPAWQRDRQQATSLYQQVAISE
jgi:hypothetical protein